MKTILMILICLAMFFSTGCSAMVGFEFDGENWKFKLGGDVPKIPLIDYEKDLL